jgi:two-component sensor histidine kinase
MKLFGCLMALMLCCSVEYAAQGAGAAVIAGNQTLLPEQFTITVGDMNVTSQVVQQKLLTLHTSDRYMDLQLAGIGVGDSCVYRIAPYDPHWLPYRNGPVRLGLLPEGRFQLQVMHQHTGNLLCNIPVQVRGGLFYGMRGYLILFTILGMGLVIFYWVRSFFLKKDRNRTVRYLENTVMKRTTQLQELVNQREMLLKEIHHRVKNNLQVISALLEMQGARTKDENVKAAITEGQNRVLSIAFIHQNLYQHDDLKGVEIDSFLKELISHIRQVFERPDCPVEVVNHVPKFHLDIDSAIPLGLLINELLTNAYKYAFRERTNGRIVIRIDDLGNGTYYFCFADNGVGLPANFDFTRSNTLGMKLIRQLSRQLAGSIVYKFEEGSKFELTFKNLEARSRML